MSTTHRCLSVTLICQKCGQPFHPWKKDKPSKYCSNVCAQPGRKRQYPDLKCAACGCAFRPTNSPGRAAKQRNAYCSRACYVAHAQRERQVTNEGYYLVYEPNHPKAYPSGQVLEHRLVMEQVIGRYLEPDETVHHINGDRADNRPENLQLRKGKHGNGQVHQCADCGSTNIITVRIADS